MDENKEERRYAEVKKLDNRNCSPTNIQIEDQKNRNINFLSLTLNCIKY